MLAIYKKEMRTYFTTPLGYVFISHHMALVLLDVANNRLGSAIAKLFKPERCLELPE